MRRVRNDCPMSLSLMSDRNVEEIICCASLAHHGLLGSVGIMKLLGIDLSQVPTQHLASLASCVTGDLFIQNVSGCDLVSVLDSLNCEMLRIGGQSLGREETQALVQAMDSRLEIVMLGDQVTLDIEALAEYNGHGVCRILALEEDTVIRYGEELKTWARSRKWGVDDDMPHYGWNWLIFNKKLPPSICSRNDDSHTNKN